uniref:DNA polymerase epsilon catalytic subunit n=1 Tax=Heligmosomoides polygyrus TaxID=6339 RepID=A0A183G7A7_HELPZ
LSSDDEDKAAVVEPDVEDESGSDSDAPAEISSKVVPDIKLGDEAELSIFEQVYTYLNRIFVPAFVSQALQSTSQISQKSLMLCPYVSRFRSAQFKVVTLSEGVNKSLEPMVNFREELLKARTAAKREKGNPLSLLVGVW